MWHGPYSISSDAAHSGRGKSRACASRGTERGSCSPSVRLMFFFALFWQGVYQQMTFPVIPLFNNYVGMSGAFRSIRSLFPEIGWKEASGTWGTFGLSSLSFSAYQRRHLNSNLSLVGRLRRILKAFCGLCSRQGNFPSREWYLQLGAKNENFVLLCTLMLLCVQPACDTST